MQAVHHINHIHRIYNCDTYSPFQTNLRRAQYQVVLFRVRTIAPLVMHFLFHRAITQHRKGMSSMYENNNHAQGHTFPIEIIERILIEAAKIDSSNALKAALVRRTLTSLAIKTTLLHGPTPTLVTCQGVHEFFKILLETHGCEYKEPRLLRGSRLISSLKKKKKESRKDAKSIHLPLMVTDVYTLDTISRAYDCNRHIKFKGLCTVAIREYRHFGLSLQQSMAWILEQLCDDQIWQGISALLLFNLSKEDLKEYASCYRRSYLKTFVFYTQEEWSLLVGKENDHTEASYSDESLPFVSLRKTRSTGAPIHIINLRKVQSDQFSYCKVTEIDRVNGASDYHLYTCCYAEKDFR